MRRTEAKETKNPTKNIIHNKRAQERIHLSSKHTEVTDFFFQIFLYRSIGNEEQRFWQVWEMPKWAR